MVHKSKSNKDPTFWTLGEYSQFAGAGYIWMQPGWPGFVQNSPKTAVNH
jgi:hypothetical protein